MMKTRRTVIRRMSAVLATLLLLQVGWAEDGHDDHDDHDEHDAEESALILDESERRKAGVEVGPVQRRALSNRLRLPGEVRANAYRSALVAPRIPAQVIRRHVTLGEAVTASQPLVTLSSVEMADAQGALIVADQEWQRAEGLGKDLVSNRRYTEAEVARQQALAKVLAYGMSDAQASRLLSAGRASRATGEFDMLAPVEGTIIQDEFLLGEFIEPGRVLFEISDESTMWVEARTATNAIRGITEGMPARISVDGSSWRDGTVVQIHHRLDETTRTQAVRIEVNNEDDWLHAGQFVEVDIGSGSEREALAAPSDAVVLLKGDAVVFHLEGDNEFHPAAVTTGDSFGNWIEITGGLEEGDVIATTGVFFLKSLVLKSDLGEGHAH